MQIYFKDKSPINLDNVEYIHFVAPEIALRGTIRFHFKHNYEDWKFDTIEIAEKVYQIILDNYFTEITIN